MPSEGGVQAKDVFRGLYFRSLDSLHARVVIPLRGGNDEMQCVLGTAVVWSAIWLIDGVLNLVGATRVADELFQGSATDLIVYWSGYWWTYLVSRSVLWGVPIIVFLPIASFWTSSIHLRLSHRSRSNAFESANRSAEELLTP